MAPSPAPGNISPSGNVNDEKDAGSVAAEVLLDGMLAKDRLLDILEHFILFDDSRRAECARSSPATTRCWA